MRLELLSSLCHRPRRESQKKVCSLKYGDDAFSAANPMRATEEVTRSVEESDAYHLYLAPILAFVFYLLHYPLGPLSLKVYPTFKYDVNGTGCNF